MKYLLDSPEVMWGCLDSKQYMEAVRRLLRAQVLHQQLHKNFPPEVLGKFRLMSHQWPLVLKFR